MKKTMWFMSAATLVASLVLLGRPASAFAAKGDGEPAERLERLERRVNEVAERQEQFMRGMSERMERQGQMESGAGEGRRPQLMPAGGTMPAMPHSPAAKAAKGLQDMLGLLFLIGILSNILLTVWIYTDIRKRGEGSGIFVALALVAGIPAAIIYTLTRIGDKKA